MLHADLILTLTAGLGAAAFFGYCTQRMGLSPIVGYLLAGILVGPHTPGFVANQAIADQLAEIGVILLMFGVGLQFHVHELLAVKTIAIPGALVQSGVATALGMVVAAMVGWSWQSGLIFGLAVSVASTVVLLRVLSDRHDLHTQAGHIAVGWLVIEDVLIVIALVILPIAVGGGQGSGSVVIAVGWALAKITLLVALIAIGGRRALPWILERIAASGSRELFTLVVLALVLGVAVGSAKVFGVSMALGAFLAGLVVGRSDFGLRAASDAMPMRDAFAVLFFVAVGMLFAPGDLLASPGLALATLAIVLVAKPLTALAIVLLLRRPFHTGARVAVALAQIGEFSFMLMALGREHDLVSQAAANAIIAAAILSIALNPLLYRALDPLERWIARHPRLAARLNAWERQEPVVPPAAVDERPIAVVVGAGPVGRTLIGILGDHGIHAVVVEMNLATVRRLRSEGVDAHYGDAAHPNTLAHIDVSRASALYLTSAGMAASAEVIRAAKAVNPSLRIVVRVDYLSQAQSLRDVGADHVVADEGEVAWTMAESLLRSIGSDHQRIRAERERIWVELGTPLAPAKPKLLARQAAADSTACDKAIT